MAYLAENEKSVRQLWDQYSVCPCTQPDEIEPVRGELPIRQRAPHLLLPRQRHAPADGMLRRRAAPVGPGQQQHAEVVARPRRSHLQRGLESLRRGGSALRLLLSGQYASASGSTVETAKLWGWQDDAPVLLQTLSGHLGRVTTVKFHPSGDGADGF